MYSVWKFEIQNYFIDEMIAVIIILETKRFVFDNIITVSNNS